MPKAEVLALVDLLGNDQAEEKMVLREFDTVMVELGDNPVMTRATMIDGESGRASYDMPTTAFRLLDVLYDQRHLTEARVRDLDNTAGRGWRSESGKPRAYVKELEGERSFRLYPIPDADTDKPIFPFGSPFGEDWGLNGIIIIHSEERDETPGWLDLWIALLICSRVFARDSKWRDPTFATTCGEMAVLIEKVIVPHGARISQDRASS